MDAEPIAWGAGECTVRIGEFSLRATCGETGSRGPVKIVARPERLRLLSHDGAGAGADGGRPNCLPGIVDRTIYVGASRQVIIRLATGAVMQATITNTGNGDGYAQGTPVRVEVPADALRVLAPSASDSASASDAGGAAAAPEATEPVAAGAH